MYSAVKYCPVDFTNKYISCHSTGTTTNKMKTKKQHKETFSETFKEKIALK